MDELLVKGNQKFMGKEIPVLEGGFGEGKRCLTDKTIAETHNQPIPEIRRRINDNIKRFKTDIDIIDLKVMAESHNNLELLQPLGYSKMQISKAKNIYILSERGYAKLIKIMDTDLAWEIHDKLMDEYFTMREIINSNEQLKANLLLSIYNGGQEGVLASKQLTELEVKEATKPLIDKIDTIEPLADKYNIYLDTEGLTDVNEFSKSLGIKGLGRNNMYRWLRDEGYFMQNNQPYQRWITQKLFILKPNGFHKNKVGENVPDFKTYFTKKGVNYILEKLIDYGLVKIIDK